MWLQNTISDSVGRDARISKAVDGATEVLGELIGDFGMPVLATWDYISDPQGNGAVRLTLGEATDTATMSYAPSELMDRQKLERSLNRVLGIHMRMRLHEQVNSILQPASGGPEK